MQLITKCLMGALLLIGSLCHAQGNVQALNAVAPLLPILVSSSDGEKADGGQAVEIVNEVGRRAGIPIVIGVQPWTRAMFTATNSPNTLFFPVVRTSDREALFEWIGPVNRIEYWVFKRKDSPAPAAKALQELKQASIGVLANDALSSYLQAELPQAKIQSMPKYESLTPMLIAGRFDYLVAVRAPFMQNLDQLGIVRGEVQPLFQVQGNTSDSRAYLVMSKGSDPTLVSKLRKALKSMEDDGVWEKTYRKYQ